MKLTPAIVTASGERASSPAAGARLARPQLRSAGATPADCGRDGRSPAFEAIVRSGKEATGLDAVAWCKRAEELGAGEILLTSVDRDGTNAGFDLELLRTVTSTVFRRECSTA